MSKVASAIEEGIDNPGQIEGWNAAGPCVLDAIVGAAAGAGVAKATGVIVKRLPIGKFKDKFGHLRNPHSLPDQMALNAVNLAESKVIIPVNKIKDPKFQGFEKRQFKFEASNGDEVVINFMHNPTTNVVTDFKFKKRFGD